MCVGPRASIMGPTRRATSGRCWQVLGSTAGVADATHTCAHPLGTMAADGACRCCTRFDVHYGSHQHQGPQQRAAQQRQGARALVITRHQPTVPSGLAAPRPTRSSAVNSSIPPGCFSSPFSGPLRRDQAGSQLPRPEPAWSTSISFPQQQAEVLVADSGPHQAILVEQQLRQGKPVHVLTLTLAHRRRGAQSQQLVRTLLKCAAESLQLCTAQ